MKPIVKIENISKRYQVGGLHPGYVNFREVFAGAVFKLFKRRSAAVGPVRGAFWALRDISFEVRQGELLGIIGRNGAGKSTLLKILSRITKPTTGRVAMRGRIGSLLEVGTGFHPDLTGRENIFLNGAILGMRKAEIGRKFDEIVCFSEVEEFIDTPVKHYSSGMYVRLAFSVAAHLEPEILIMDEVLAVGDAAFQQKCLDKMHDIRQQGRTIFFVSHNMSAVARLCKRVILLDRGSIRSDGPAGAVVNEYLNLTSSAVSAEREWDDAGGAPGDGVVRLRRARIRTMEGRTAATVDVRRPVGIEITYEVLTGDCFLSPGVDVDNEAGVHLFSSRDLRSAWRGQLRPAGVYTSTAWIPGDLLAEGRLLVHVSIASYAPASVLHVYERNAVAFRMTDGEKGDPANGDHVDSLPGVVNPLLNWTTDLAPLDPQSNRDG